MYKTQYNEHIKLWSGRNIVPLYNPKISIVQVVLNSCLNNASKIAQISDDCGISLTYDEIRIRIIRAAQNLQKRGFKPNQVFASIAKNSKNLAPIVFATLGIGCSINTLEPSFTKTELLHMLNIIQPSLLFCDVDTVKLINECLIELDNNAPIFVFGDCENDWENVENLFAETNIENDFVPVEIDGVNTPAAIPCSSGTTGFSKGVCLSHAAILDGAANFDVVGTTDVILCFSSLYWVTGWIFLIAGTIKGATRIITTQPFTGELQLQLIEQYKVTVALNAPHHLSLITKCDRLKYTNLSTIKYQLVTGGKCSIFTQTKIDSHLPNGRVYAAYGLSEAGSVMSMNINGNDSVGQLVPCFSIKIIDDNGKRCGIDQDGEICFKGNYPFLGYYGNQQATNDVFDDDGFFLSSDIGHFDANGNLFIVDRKKDLIKYCSFQISPSLIESYLVKLSDIKSACVVGIPDDANDNYLPAAFIIRNENSTITENDIHDLVSEHFADYCKLRGGVYFVETFPRTPSGKLLRRKVREMAIEMANNNKLLVK